MTIPGRSDPLRAHGGPTDIDATRPRRTGIVLRDPLPWADLLQVVGTAEDTGHESVFVPEIAGREAFSTLAGFAGHTDRIRLGTGVVTVRARGPVGTAMAAATVQDVSRGRHVLGIGAGSPPVGASAPRPLALVREYVRVVRGILAGQPVRSEPLGVDGFQLELPLASGPPPIWLAALGDGMLELAGAIADGVLMNWCTPERVGAARQILDRAARGAGRRPEEVTLAVYVRAFLGAEDPVALPPLRQMTGVYASIPHYRRQMEAMGLGEEAAAAAAALERGRPGEVPEALVRALTVTGGREEALARFDRFHRSGADLVMCYPVPAEPDPLSSVLGTVMASAPTTMVER